MPVAVEEATVIVIVEVPAPVIELGLNDRVTPEGCPLAVRAIEESNPPLTVLVMVELPEPPCAIETDAGEAERLKPGPDDCVPAKALSRPLPLGLPQPVAKSYPVVAE